LQEWSSGWSVAARCISDSYQEARSLFYSNTSSVKALLAFPVVNMMPLFPTLFLSLFVGIGLNVGAL
jgi:hypothetical protein